MKNRIFNLVTMGILSLSLVSDNFIVRAENDIPKPQKPTIEGELTNDKINEYNEQVAEYNKQVDAYNKKIDEKYESDKAAVASQNAQIEAHNQQEQANLDAVNQRNTEAQAKYDTEMVQYNKDLEFETWVKSKGFESVEAYNAAVQPWITLGETAVEKNSDATNIFDIDKSYTITQDEGSAESQTESTDEPEPAEPEKVKVHIEHNFTGSGISYTKDLEIDMNDTITFYAAGAQLQTTEPGYSSFYLHTTDDYLRGYWNQTDSILMCNAKISDGGWNCGNYHTVSYSAGKNHASDSTDIDMVYNYSWQAIPKYTLGNIPKQPELNLEEYTPNFQEKVADPVKGEYLTYLDTMDLLPEPEPEPTPTEDPVPVPEPDPQPTPTEDKKDEVQPSLEPSPEPAPQEEEKKEHKKKKKKSEKKTEETKEEDNAETQPSNETKPEEKAEEPAPAIKAAPAQTEIVKVSKPSPAARQGSTGDNSKIALRAILLALCVFLLFGLLLDSIDKRNKRE